MIFKMGGQGPKLGCCASVLVQVFGIVFHKLYNLGGAKEALFQIEFHMKFY
jgi:hypothetical protein